MSIEQPRNLSYLLRLWRVERNGEPVWWASLENPRTGERQSFADLAELFAFLDEKTVNAFQPTEENDLELSSEIAIESITPECNTRPRYLSYILRLLWMDREGKPAWWVFLQSSQSTERRNFTNPEALMHYLEEKLRESAD